MFPTVAALAEHLADVSTENQPMLPVSELTKAEQLPLTPAQWRTWFLDQFEPGQSNYNIPILLRLNGALNFHALEQSFTALYRRHEALRAIFPVEDGKSVQIICEPREVQLPVSDFSEVPESEREEAARAAAAKEAAKPYVMSRPVLRPRLLRLSETEHLLLIVTHGVACDAISTRILVEELVAFYGGFASGHPVKLPTPRRRYSAAWRACGCHRTLKRSNSNIGRNVSKAHRHCWTCPRIGRDPRIKATRARASASCCRKLSLTRWKI